MGDLYEIWLLGGVLAALIALGHLKHSLSLAHLLRTPPSSAEPIATALPAVSILAPCRGVDHQFETYVQALLSQHYPRYEVLFLVESPTDPAWAVLHDLLEATPGARASLLVVGTAQDCSQKIHNLRAGLTRVAAETTVLTFVDSDAQVHPEWLRALVQPLHTSTIGATTGFRWYVPARGSLASGLRSAWNATMLGLIAHSHFGFAWGGSMAIQRELFGRLAIDALWSRGLSDDLLLTRAVRTAGLGIAFVTAGLVPTYEPCSWRQLFEWSNRQVTIGRMYAPRAWGISFLACFTSMFIGMLGLLALGTGQWLAAGLLTSYWVLHGIGSMAVCQAAIRRLAMSGYPVSQRTWAHALWGPAVTLLTWTNMLISLTRRTITWRGITYTMRSPHHTIVHRGREIPAPSSRPS